MLSRGIDVPSVTVARASKTIHDEPKSKKTLTCALCSGVCVQVVNYDLPNGTEKMETYLHRIGRTGRPAPGTLLLLCYVQARTRFGKKGLAVNLASDRDRHRIDEIKR